ncbi:MAG: hypothetical protein CMJ78_10760 [Planctomycetaceae bacterium]|nr:hypothetical protein [Planctomycetaceae bacterium]
MNTPTTRREFTKQSLGAVLTYSLLETVAQTDAFADKVKPTAEKWLRGVHELASDVKDRLVSQVLWQKKTEELFAQANLDELLELIDFETLTKNIKLVENGARSLRFRFPQVEGLPKQLVFGKQIFAIKKGRSVVPHGHNNMATAFLILKGKFDGKHYDRLEDVGNEAFIIKPTIDKEFGPGGFSTVSDYKDNIHWFKGIDDLGFIFNIHVLNVTPGSQLPTGRVYVDPDGEKLKGGLIKARKLRYKEAHEMYG